MYGCRCSVASGNRSDVSLQCRSTMMMADESAAPSIAAASDRCVCVTLRFLFKRRKKRICGEIQTAGTDEVVIQSPIQNPFRFRTHKYYRSLMPHTKNGQSNPYINAHRFFICRGKEYSRGLILSDRFDCASTALLLCNNITNLVPFYTILMNIRNDSNSNQIYLY